MNLRARLRDFLHELRIARLHNAHRRATELCLSRDERMRTWREFQLAVTERSPAQIKRLNKLETA
jgi:hypothetical protein